MIKSFITYFVFPVFAALGLFFFFVDMAGKEELEAPKQAEAKNVPTPAVAPALVKKAEAKMILPVPYVSEAPEGIWHQPWVNACEEATIMMVDGYYRRQESISVADAKAYLQNLFDMQDELYGSNRNADSRRIAAIISRENYFNTEVIQEPDIEDIKNEIREGRPVLSLHRGFDLENPNIEFSPTLSSYHTLVVVGFDDEKGVFIVHDPGDEVDGANHEYEYELFMNSLHDYDEARNKADRAPTVIFTRL